VQDQEAALPELRVADDEPLGRHVFESQVERLGDAEARTGNQPEQGAVDPWLQRGLRTQGPGLTDESRHLRRREEKGRSPPRSMSTEGLGRRDLMAIVLRVEVASQVDDRP
jgi:hypothetical protein